MFTFRRLRERLYELRFDDQYEMCMAFLRYQEYYESPRFEKRKFTLAQYMAWYVRDQNKDGRFSYPSDWGGFNIPARIIGEVQRLGIDDPNHYDQLMGSLYQIITVVDDDAYLIGVTGDGEVNAHETTHAMWHIDAAYRNRAKSLMDDELPLVNQLIKVLKARGYTDITALDEVQTYMTTGDSLFKEFKKKADYKRLQKKLKQLHGDFYPNFTKDIDSRK